MKGDPDAPRAGRRPVTVAAWIFAGVVVLAGVAIVVGLRAPRSDRDWAVDHARPARIAFEGDRVHVSDLRDFRHAKPGESVEGYRDTTIDLDEVRRVWFVLAPFAKRWRGLAHSLFSFELADGRFVAVSVEARREADETYSLLGGLMRAYEVTYVVGTETDVIGQRAVRGDTLFVYPARASAEQARELFVAMLRRAEAVRVTPEFYHTFTNNCTTNLRDAVNAVADDALPWGWGILLPGYSDALALDHGLLDTELTIDAARERFRVDERARALLEGGAGDDFGRRLREGLLPAGDPQ